MDASTLSYVVTSSSATLSTPLGCIEFHSDEFFAYKCMCDNLLHSVLIRIYIGLFEIIDIDEDGRVSFNSSYDLLQRSLVPRVYDIAR